MSNKKPPNKDGNETDKNTKGDKAGTCYCDKVVKTLRWTYVFGIIIWIMIVYFLALTRNPDIIVWIILIVPIVLFVVGIYNADKITIDVEDNVFGTNSLALGLLIVIPLLSWVNNDFKGDKKRFVSILVVAVIFSMFSMIDIWTTSRWISIVRHSKSILQTYSLILLIFALYSFYIEQPNLVFSKMN